MPNETGFSREMVDGFEHLIRNQMPFEETDVHQKMAPIISREWYKFLSKYKRCSKFLRTFLAYGETAFEDFDRDYIRKKIAVISSWIEEARAQFLAGKISFLWECRILDHKERPKHWRPQGFPEAEIIRQSKKNREGIFVPNMVTGFLIQGLRCLFVAHYDKVRSRKLRFASFDYGMLVGYAEGEPTSIVRYDIDYTAKHAHAYPISEQEARRHPHVTLDDLNLQLARRVKIKTPAASAA